MFCLIDICTLCLKTNNLLHTLHDKHDSLTYYQKLSIFLPDFVAESDQLKICGKCCEDINSAHEFRKRCITNINMYNMYMDNLRSVGVKRGVIDVLLNDIFKNPDSLVDSQVTLSNLQNNINVSANLDSNIKVEVEDEDSEDYIKNEIVARENTVDVTEKINMKQEHSSDERKRESGIKVEPEDHSSEVLQSTGLTGVFEHIYIQEHSSIVGKTEDLEVEREYVKNAQFRVENYHYAQSTEKEFKLRPDRNVEMKKEQGHQAQSSENITSTRVPGQSNISEQVTSVLEIKSEIMPEHLIEEAAQEEMLDSTEDVQGECSLGNAEAQTTVEQCRCTHCGKVFARAGQLKRHSRIHSLERPYKCAECERAFSFVNNLTKHMRVHSGQTPYKCTVCERPFSQAGHLKDHMMIHSGERPFSCTQCEKTFRQASHLKRHLTVHSGERSFKCTVCERTFNFASNLKEHMRVHSGDKPYSCSVCERTFSLAGNLKDHMVVHSGDRPFRCTQCEKTFSRAGDLKVHMRIHNGERPYGCPVCGKTFSQAGHLKSHMKVHSGERS